MMNLAGDGECCVPTNEQMSSGGGGVEGMVEEEWPGGKEDPQTWNNPEFVISSSLLYRLDGSLPDLASSP